MSMRYRGSIMWATLPTVNTTSASGAWTLAQQMQYQAAGTWPFPVNGWAVSASSVTNPTGASYQVVVPDGSGGAYFAGSVQSSKAVAITKVGAGGSVEWQRTFTTSLAAPNATVTAGVLMPNGDAIIQGALNNSSPLPNRMFLMRVTSSGSVSAFRSYASGTNFTYPGGVAVDSAGNIYAAMYVSSAGVSHFFAKIDPTTLATTWVAQTQGSPNFNSIAVTPDGSGVYIAGYNNTFGYGYINRCSTTDGSSVWEARITAINGAFPANTIDAISVDSNNNVFIVAANYGVAANICKFNSSGVLQWAKGFSTAGTYVSPVTRTDSSGNVYAAMGWSVFYSASNGFDNSVAIAKLDTSGNTLFSNATNSYVVNNGYGAVGFDVSSNSILKVSRYGGDLLYQRLPGDGSGYGLYAGGSSYFPYSPGPTFSNGNVTTSVTTRSTFANSLTTVSDAPSSSNTTNSYTTTINQYPLSSGSALYFQPGTYSWIAPSGVTSVAALCIGGGGGGGGSRAGGTGCGGGGGGLAYKNAISVTPGTAYTVVVGAQGNGGDNTGTAGTAGGQSSFINTSTLYANGGNGGNGGNTGSSGGLGGSGGGTGATFYSGGQGGGNTVGGGGGGGAAGYAGNGGSGGTGNSSVPVNGTNGSGGSGAGGPSGYYFGTCGEDIWYGGSNGGHVGVIGQGSSGVSAGGTNVDGSKSNPQNFGRGGYGEGMSYNACVGAWGTGVGGRGSSGAVRILWGAGRSFPTTNVSTP